MNVRPKIEWEGELSRVREAPLHWLQLRKPPKSEPSLTKCCFDLLATDSPFNHEKMDIKSTQDAASVAVYQAKYSTLLTLNTWPELSSWSPSHILQQYIVHLVDADGLKICFVWFFSHFWGAGGNVLPFVRHNSKHSARCFGQRASFVRIAK